MSDVVMVFAPKNIVKLSIQMPMLSVYITGKKKAGFAVNAINQSDKVSKAEQSTGIRKLKKIIIP